MLVGREQAVGSRASLQKVCSEVSDPVSEKVDTDPIAAHDRGIEELVTGDADFVQNYRILLSVPGVGPVAAAAP